MNKDRRKQITEARSKIEEIKGKLEDRLNEVQAEFASQLEDVKGELETIRDDEQSYYDNMPESLQGGEKGDKSQEAIDALDEAISGCEDFDLDAADIVSNLGFDDITSKLDDAENA